MNEQAAKEWLSKTWHHYSSGKILYDVEHYTDVIAIDLHYSVEITLKAFLAFDNSKILKTHDLNELALILIDKITFDDDEQRLLAIISKYHIKGSYPTPDRNMPSRDELNNVLEFQDRLFNQVCTILEIDPNEVKK